MKISDDSLWFATAFYHASGSAPNARTVFRRSKPTMYYRCMIVCFATIRRLYPEARLSLFTNRTPPDPFHGQLESIRVDTVICAGRYVDDPAFRNDFPGCLFTLDVIDCLARDPSAGFSHVILLDSDCIVRLRLDAMVKELENRGERIYAYETGYPVHQVFNGQSRATLTLQSAYFSGQTAPSPIASYGGEFYCLPAGSLPRLAGRIRNFWAWMKSEGVGSFGNCLTEEHVMSVVLAGEKGTVHTADGLIKRIWTASNYSNVDGNESGIPIWHLPSEKKKGFVRLYRYWVRNNGFADLGEGDLLRLIDKAVPLRTAGRKYPGRSLLRRLKNSVKAFVGDPVQ